jgi:aromatic-L-amino-acid decarboxylase
MSDPDVPHMPADEFIRRGEEILRGLADYYGRLETLPVLPDVKPGDVYAGLPQSPPAHGETWDAILRDAIGPGGVIEPALTHWQSPNFFAFFPANSSYPAVLADLLCSGLAVQGMLWQTSPACTELETKMLDWLAGILGLPSRFLSGAFGSGAAGAGAPRGGGVIQGTASEATLVTLLAARRRAIARCAAQIATTAGAPHLTLYASTQAHSSVMKAAMIAGLARDPEDHTHLRPVETNDRCEMDPAALRRAMAADAAAGRVPFYVCATVGTTSSTAIDPLPEVGAAAREHGAWLHADGAHALAACVCPEHRWMLAGAELCDSICFNPHKWLLTNFDCDCLWVADRPALVDALSVTPEYLRNAATESGEVIDYRDWQIPLGRRFRALKLWFVIRHYGVEGLRAHIRKHIVLAEQFEAFVRADERFEVSAPRTVNLVCFRLSERVCAARRGGAEAANAALLERIGRTRRIYLTHTRLPRPDRLVLRFAVGSPLTETRHVDAAWELIRATAEDVLS